MDGALRTVALESFFKQGAVKSPEDAFFGLRINQLAHEWTFESSVCVMAVAYVRCADNEYFIIGFENGAIGVLNHNKPVQQIFKPTGGAKDDFKLAEEMAEHSNAVVAVEVFPDGPKAAAAFKRKDASGVKENANNESLVLSADRDGEVILWKVSSANKEQIL